MKPLPRGLCAASRMLNLLTGGSRAEMLCSRAWRRGWWWITTPCDALFSAFRGEDDHCRACWEQDFIAGNSPWHCRDLSSDGRSGSFD